MTEDVLRNDIERGHRAKVLLEDGLLTEAFDNLKSSYRDAWEATQFRDTDARERLWQAVQIIGNVHGHLRSVLANGQIAKKEIEDLEKMGERRKVFGIV